MIDLSALVPDTRPRSVQARDPELRQFVRDQLQADGQQFDEETVDIILGVYKPKGGHEMSSASSIRQRIHEQHAERQEQDRAKQAAERVAEQLGYGNRQPVGAFEKGGTVICNDGSVFHADFYPTPTGEKVKGWIPGPPIPGTPADDEEDGAR